MRAVSCLLKDKRSFDISNEKKYPLMRKAPEGIAGSEWHLMLMEKAKCRRPELLDDLHKIYLARATELSRSGISPRDILETISAEKPDTRTVTQSSTTMKP